MISLVFCGISSPIEIACVAAHMAVRKAFLTTALNC